MTDGWADAWTDDALRRRFGEATYERGAAYARAGRVGGLSTANDSRMVVAEVSGTRETPYRTVIILDADVSHASSVVATHCTCPVGVECKHAAAVMIAARDDLSGALAGEAAWEREVTALLESREPAGDRPIALQFERTTPRTSFRWAAGGEMSGRLVKMRPVIRGRSGRWIRTGATWQEMRHAYATRGYVAQHRDVMRQLVSAYDAHRSTGWRGNQTADAVDLGDFGPGLWGMLERAQDAGVEFVAVRPDDGPIRLATATAEVRLDLTRAVAADATLAAEVTIDGRRVPDAALALIGSPPHGVADLSKGIMLARLDQIPSPRVAGLLGQQRQVEIPAGELDRFLGDYYPALRQQITVSSSDDSVELPEIEPPRLLLTVRPESHDAMWIEWSFAYAARRVRLAGADRFPARDTDAERRLLAELTIPDELATRLWTEGVGTRLVPAQRLSGYDAVLLVEWGLDSLREQGVDVEVLGTLPDYRPAAEAPVIEVSATESDDEIDWFDLRVSVSVDGHDVPLASLLAALAAGQTLLVLENGTYLPLDQPELERLRRIVDEARALVDSDGDAIRISTYQIGMWEELTQLGVVDVQSERWRRAVDGLMRLEEAPVEDVPQGIKAELRPYQVDGYQWLSFLWQHELGGILADDMGLGKTVQTLAMVCRAVESGDAKAPFLVVAPTSVVPNWTHEAELFAPGLRVGVVSETGAKRGQSLAEVVGESDVVVTSYTLLRLEAKEYAELPWSGVVLDEAQMVKNHRAKSYRSVRMIPAPFKVALTGTPLENSLMDLWSLLSIVAPGLFPDPKRFGEHFRKPIERGDAELLATLRQRIRPLMRRRTKEQVASELPPKQEQVLEIALHPRHRKVYETHLQRERQKLLGLLGDVDRNRIAIFRSLTLLRQLSLHPGLVDEKYAAVSSSKIDALAEYLLEAVSEGHRALVFSQFTGFLGLVRARLDAEGIAYSYLDGRTRKREEPIGAFKRGEVPVFLISLKAGGFGLNLAEADYCFVLDPWWNPAAEAQAVDRAHRIGQDKTVMVYRMVSANTIEEKVMALKERKQALFDRVMADDGALSGALTVEEIRGLVGLE
ncbi:MAG TPA: DEAD/DEAH box helicase [Nocardioidaceae bacterium]|nr:DEAD/DEAH box helicase [Nocardioidaceae bacterium]